MKLKHLGVALATVAPLFLGAMSVNAETLKIQALWGAGSVTYQAFERFAKSVAAVSGGDLTIEAMPVRTVVAHNETLEAVGSGILDGHHSALVYFSGREPAFALLGDLNAAYERPEQMREWFYHRGGIKLARELYAKYNLYFVGPVWWGVESIPVKKKVVSVSDFAGVKLRIPEGPSSDLFREMKAAPVNIPGSEVFTSLERGVIDGTDWGTLSMNYDLGYHKIAKFHIYPGIHSMPTGDIAINLDKWNSLSDKNKALLEMAVQNFSTDMVSTLRVRDIEAKAEIIKAGGQIIDWSPSERKKIRSIASKVWKKYSTRSELAKKVYESQMAYLKELGLL